MPRVLRVIWFLALNFLPHLVELQNDFWGLDGNFRVFFIQRLSVLKCGTGNVLLLRNIIELSLDIPEVSQQKLLSLVAERLLDSNSNLEVPVPLTFLMNQFN